MVRAAVLPDGFGGNGKTSWAVAGTAKPALSVRVSRPLNNLKLIGRLLEA
jgi:hypothetical protein